MGVGFAGTGTENRGAMVYGESITVTLKSKKGKVFDAILTPKGIRRYEYEKDGKAYSGFTFDFDMGFPEK